MWCPEHVWPHADSSRCYFEGFCASWKAEAASVRADPVWQVPSEKVTTLAAALGDKKHLCLNSPTWTPPPPKKKKCLGAEQKKHNEEPVGGQVLETEQPDTVSRLGRMHPVSGMSVICKTIFIKRLAE